MEATTTDSLTGDATVRYTDRMGAHKRSGESACITANDTITKDGKHGPKWKKEMRRHLLGKRKKIL